MKLLRTLRLDPSDTFVFAEAAEPGEWAVTGSFLFWDADPASLGPKERAAFRAGFVGVASLGFSTLTTIVEATEEDRAAAVEALAGHLHARFGAPSLDAARAVAREEVDFAASLCAEAPGTVVALHRAFEDGTIRERFRTLRRREAVAGADRLHRHARAFEFVEVEDDAQERVDLIGMVDGR